MREIKTLTAKGGVLSSPETAFEESLLTTYISHFDDYFFMYVCMHVCTYVCMDVRK